MDPVTEEKVDDKFKDSLKFIRPYIIALTNHEYITSCRVWLEKMSGCPPEEKLIRNELIGELCRQIQTGKLDEPFDSPPQHGPLVPLDKSHYSSNSWSDMSTMSHTTLEVPGSAETGNTPQVQSPHAGNRKNNFQIVGDNINKLPPMYQQLPTMYQNNLSKLTQTIEELKQQNMYLSNLVKQQDKEMTEKNSQAESGISVLTGEVEYLKSRLKELINIKRNLATSHNAIVFEWETATRNLEKKLQEAQKENSKLQSTIKTLEDKLQKCSTSYNNAERDNDLLESHKQEVFEIREKNYQIIKRLEEKYTELIKNREAEFNARVTDLMTEYENRIEEVNAEAEKNCRCKDEEINRLQTMVQDQCDNFLVTCYFVLIRMQKEVVYIRSHMEQQGSSPSNEAMVDKISFLQKCIIKMEKLLRKYEKHYTKRIVALKRDLEVKESSIQIQLSTQRAQLLAQTSNERQSEIEEIVCQLEKRYRTLLEEQQAQANATRLQDLELIKQLTDKLDAINKSK